MIGGWEPLSALRSDDVDAAIDVDRLAGRARGQIAGEPHRRVPDVGPLHTSAKGRLRRGLFTERVGTAHRGNSKGSQVPAGNDVHADLLRPQVRGKVAGRALERGLRDAHDVVAGYDLLRPV